MANQEVVGILRAILTADTAQFDANMQRSAAKVTAFGQETTKAAANIAKSLSGQALVKQATDTAKAIELIGGAAKLTAAEAARLEPVFSNAIAKLKAMGVEVPPAMMKTQAALKGMADQSQKSGEKVGFLEGRFASLAASFSAGLLIDRGVTAIIGFGREAFAAGGHIQDMSTKLGVSMEAVQRWTFAAKQTGTDMDGLGRSVTFLSDQLAGNGKAIIPSLRLLNLEFEHLRNLKTEDAVNEIFTAIKKLPDAMQQIQVAKDLFGKTGVELLSGIKEGMVEIGNQALVMSDDTVRALDKAGDAWQKFYDGMVVITGTFLGNIQRALDSKKTTLATLWALMSGVNPGMALEFGGNVGLADQKTPPPTPPGAPKKKPAADADSSIKRFNDEVKALADTLTGKNIAKEIEKLSAAFESVSDWTAISAEQWADGAKKALALRDAGGKLTSTLDYVVDSARELDDTFSKFDSSMTIRTNAFLRSLHDGTQGLPEQIRDVSDSLGAMWDIGRNPPTDVVAKWFGAGKDLSGSGLMQNIKLNFNTSTVANYPKLIGMAADAMSQLVVKTGKLGPAINIAEMAMRTYAQTASVAATASAGVYAGFIYLANKIIGSFAEDAAAAEAFAAELKATNQRLQELGYTMLDVNQIMGTFGQNRSMPLSRVLTVAEAMSTHVSEQFDKAKTALERFGGSAPAALQPFIQQLLNGTKLTKEQRALLEGMAQPRTWQALQEAAERYSLSVDHLGKGFNQLKSNDVFDQLFSDFTMFSESGADMNEVFKSMSAQVSDAVNRARKFGLDMPEYMRPMLEAMSKAGFLIDENGNALRDLGDIKFSASIESSMSRIADILQDIYDLFTGIAKLPSPFPIAVPRAPGQPGDGGGGRTRGMDVAMPTYDGYATSTAAWSGSSGGVSVPDSGGNVTVMAMDVQSFEGWLRSGANRAVMRTLPYAVSGAGLTR